MSSCTRLPTCSFYQGRMITESGIGKILKAKYCECNNTANCARYLVITKLGEKYLDNSLFPNMVDRAYELIALHQNDPKENEQPSDDGTVTNECSEEESKESETESGKEAEAVNNGALSLENEAQNDGALSLKSEAQNDGALSLKSEAQNDGALSLKNESEPKEDFVSLFGSVSKESEQNSKSKNAVFENADTTERVFDSLKNTALQEEIATEEPFLRLRKNEAPKKHLYPTSTEIDYPFLGE